jgi:hypothetical protein
MLCLDHYVLLDAACCVGICACSFPYTGFQRWFAVDRAGLSLILDVSLNGGKVMGSASISLEIQLPISLRLPDQTATTNVDITVWWGIITHAD